MSKKVTTLAQLRKEVKAAKAFTLEVEKDFVLILEDFNYFEDDRQMRIVELLDKAVGNTANSYAEILRAHDDLFVEWIGEEEYERLKQVANRGVRAHIVGKAAAHFQSEHGADDPKES